MSLGVFSFRKYGLRPSSYSHTPNGYPKNQVMQEAIQGSTQTTYHIECMA